MTSSTSYQPLVNSGGSSNSHHHHHHHPHQQQRKAYTFTLMIMMVAFATLLTIIRLTFSPDLSGPTTAHLATTSGGQPKPLSRFKGQNLVEQKLLLAGFHPPLPPAQSANSLNALSGKHKQLTKAEAYELLNSPSGSSQVKGSGVVVPAVPTAGKAAAAVQQQQQSNLSASGGGGVTILTADQRFEKEYRDDPVTDPVPDSPGQVPSNSPATANQQQQQPKRPPPPPNRNVVPRMPAGTARTPKLVFSPADLEETRRLRIDKKEGCGEASGAYADLLVIVNSAVGNFEARAAIRDTWGRFAVERGAYFYMLVGSTDLPAVQDRLEAEDAAHGDLLQGRFYDSYHNLTLKTMAMMRWVADRCSAIRYVLKVDDDMMLNMQHITDFSEINPNFHRVIIGKLAKRWRPHREPTNKWYVPVAAFNGSYFPNFVTGPAYFFTGDAAKPLYDTAVADRTGPLYLEDVYMTGIVAEKAGIKRFNHALIRNVHLKVDECTYPRIMTSHKHRPADIRALWKLVYSKKCQPTPPPPPAKAAAPAVAAANNTASKNSLPVGSGKVGGVAANAAGGGGGGGGVPSVLKQPGAAAAAAASSTVPKKTTL